MNREQTLDKAKECVLKDRQATHGPPEDSFSLIAKFWSAYTGHEIKPHEVAVMLGLLKIARIKHKPLHEDNWIDLAGYAACGAELAAVKPDTKSFWDGMSRLDKVSWEAYMEDLKAAKGKKMNPPLSSKEWETILKDVQAMREVDSPAPLPSSALPPHLRSDLPE